eukprot:TRINITY_DN5945_c0_g1_i1.p4 TRINITY_DN5945_c0_g1~~TRINITY_DN5945_c0_g1_i1.p4  ORF type:complete len:149 (+),score=0.80 TRINITY_DN5945_c0_g1_i1:724-1170(+)
MQYFKLLLQNFVLLITSSKEKLILLTEIDENFIHDSLFKCMNTMCKSEKIFQTLGAKKDPFEVLDEKTDYKNVITDLNMQDCRLKVPIYFDMKKNRNIPFFSILSFFKFQYQQLYKQYQQYYFVIAMQQKISLETRGITVYQSLPTQL